MSPLEAALAGLWLMLPALVPNSAAVLFGGGTPMDLGRSWRGKRVLGDGKTWRGFFGGALTGFGVGSIEIIITTMLDEQDAFGYGDLPWAVAIIAALSFGAMTGDCVGSFIKRRLGVDRGKKAPGLDQYNFVLGAIVTVIIVSPGWFSGHYIEGNGYWGLAMFLVVVPLLHRSANIIGYKLGKKNVPW
ncbi:MAG TPA: CDP-2,3-bis-(O-geranylgeranyl)-sn-glycerol synthase [Thermoplasmata archaeon]|nr:CDP-2,3-bis-(O-geranylgeranyl)-sn-glycerol synthase [Thermoplasmata archaeon]